MHILIIPSWYSTKENPVGGVFFREQARALLKAGHQVGVLVAPKIRTKKDLRSLRYLSELNTKIEREDDDGLITYRTSLLPWLPRFMRGARDQLVNRAAMEAFSQYCKEVGQPDLIHAHSILPGGWLAAQIKEKWSVPVVLTEHFSGFVQNLVAPWQSKKIQYTLRAVDKVVAVSPPLSAALSAYAPEREIEVLGNIVDTELFAPPTQEPPSSPFIFVLIARLTPRKAVDVLLRAFQKAFAGQDVWLHIAGEGEERERLELLTKELKLETQVAFLGASSREQVRYELQRSHALVSSSHKETFGVTVIEALACGKPVVATCSGGPEFIIAEHNGLLVHPGDTDALALAMKRMIQDYSQYDSAAIRDDCVSRFSEQAIVGQLDAIYSKLVAL